MKMCLSVRQTRLNILALVGIALTSMYAPKAHAMDLLSIENLQLGPDDYVAGVQIQTWRIRVRAVCRLPVGWMITVGRNLDQSGQINGEASGFMTNLNIKQINELQDFVLIDDPPPSEDKSPDEPQTFQGSIAIGTYKNPQAGNRSTNLTAENIVLRPATQCPAPTEN